MILLHIHRTFYTPLICYSFTIAGGIGITQNLPILFFIYQPGPVVEVRTDPVCKISNRRNPGFKGDGTIPDIGCIDSQYSYSISGICQTNHVLKLRQPGISESLNLISGFRAESLFLPPD